LHRSDLHQCLLRELPPEQIHTQKEVVSIEAKKDGYLLQCKDGSSYHCQYLIGADGLNSSIRNYVFPQAWVRYAGYTCWRATITLEDNFPYTSEETWGHKGRFGITPLVNQQVYWYACINSPQARNPRFAVYTITDLRNHFKGYHPAVRKVLELTEQTSLIHNDIYDIKPLSEYHKGNIVLIGDAAHATTPNLGQGACMGVEDVAVLLQEIDQQSNSTKAFEQFSKRRTKRCKYIVNTSKQMGQIAQMDNRGLLPFRNFAIRNLPKFVQKQQLQKILDISAIL
jgi:2-polyprenyl-6-methoxyphenol hydroxylase-like FAD-dependent oxidoreductase